MKLLNNFLIHLLQKYVIGLEKLMEGSNFILGCVHSLYYKCHKINPNRGGSKKQQ